MTRPPLALTALALAAGCTSSAAHLTVTGTVTATGPAAAQTASLQMHDALTFVPNVVQAKAGTLTLTLENTGGISHNLTFDDSGFGHTDTVSGHSTATLTVTFDKPGTYAFTCTFHGGMKGKVVVAG